MLYGKDDLIRKGLAPPQNSGRPANSAAPESSAFSDRAGVVRAMGPPLSVKPSQVAAEENLHDPRITPWESTMTRTRFALLLFAVAAAPSMVHAQPIARGLGSVFHPLQIPDAGLAEQAQAIPQEQKDRVHF